MFDNLELGVDENIQHGYSSMRREYNPITYDKYIAKLTELVEKNPRDFYEKPYSKYAYITGKISNSTFFRKEKHILMLDCDSIESKNESEERLKSFGIRYISIQSSPGHFWIIGDKIEPVKNHITFLETFTSVDQNYVKCAGYRNIFVLRAFPKSGFLPIFSDTSKFTGKNTFERWVLNFEKYWKIKEMENIKNTLFAEAL